MRSYDESWKLNDKMVPSDMVTLWVPQQHLLQLRLLVRWDPEIKSHEIRPKSLIEGVREIHKEKN